MGDRPVILRDDVLRRFLVAKQLLLGPGPTTPDADQVAVAKMILAAHDGAELAVAAIADQLGVVGVSERSSLMDYAGYIAKHKNEHAIPGATFFSRLNTARRAFKHEGILPDPHDWHRVIDETRRYVDTCSVRYLDTGLDDIDLTALIVNSTVKELCTAAREFIGDGNAKSALECIGQALYLVLYELPGLHGTRLGKRDPHEAMMLTAFGIRPSDFLSLQEFVPNVTMNREENALEVRWDGRETGHPANWTLRNATFCLGTVIDVALRTQHAPWHPSPIHYSVVYDDVITALQDGARLWHYKWDSALFLETDEEIEVRRLKKGDSFRGVVSVPSRQPVRAKTLGLPALLGEPQLTLETAEYLTIFAHDAKLVAAYFKRKDFALSTEPKTTDFVRKYYPHILPGRGSSTS